MAAATGGMAMTEMILSHALAWILGVLAWILGVLAGLAFAVWVMRRD